MLRIGLVAVGMLAGSGAGLEGQKLLDDVECTVPPAHVASIMGASGSGKTRLSNLISSLEPKIASVLDRCLDDAIGDAGSTPVLPGGQEIREGYFALDWNDNGAMVPIHGVSTGFAMELGIIPDAILNANGNLRQRIVAFLIDRAHTDLGRSVGLVDTGSSASAREAAVASAIAADERATTQGNASAANTVRLRDLSVLSAILMDDTGNAVFSLECRGRVSAWQTELSGGQAQRVLLQRGLTHHPGMSALHVAAIVAARCEDGDWVSAKG